MTNRPLLFVRAQELQGEALLRVADRVQAQVSTGVVRSVGPVSAPLFVGIGASHAALAVPVRELRARGVAAARQLASDIDTRLVPLQYDAVIAASVGGKSVETIEALTQTPLARRIAVVNQASSPLGRAASTVIDLGAEEDSWASTIGYNGTIVALSMLARAFVGEEARRQWDGIPELVGEVGEAGDRLSRQIAEPLLRVTSADLVGSALSLGSVEEGALLFREVGRLPSTASATHSYLHGEMEAAGNTLHIILGDCRELGLATQLAQSGHPTVLITRVAQPEQENLHVLRLPAVPMAVRAVLEAVVLQRLSTHLAGVRDIDIEEFVFANHDIKVGGITEVEFARQAEPAGRE